MYFSYDVQFYGLAHPAKHDTCVQLQKSLQDAVLRHACLEQ